MFAEVVLSLPIDKAFNYKIPEDMREEVARGMRVEVPFGNRKKLGYVTQVTNYSPVDDVKDIISAYDENVVVSERMFELANWISQNYICSLGEALSSIAPSNLRAPRRKSKKPPENKVIEPAGSPQQKPELTQDQNRALEPVIKDIQAGCSEVFVLHGITSSGKTEIYLAAIEESISHNRSAIYLLPEISLTPQFIEIVRGRFPGLVGVWHSRLTASQRFKTWDAARRGDIKIMLGARSAVFAPFSNLGLIIVDEEHEPTYKQEQKPPYQTREVAAQRVKIDNAVAIFGSATPSLESYYRAKNGQYKLLELYQRIDEHALPPVRIIDCNNISAKYRIITAPLKEALTRVLARREQAIIFLNRRGFSPAVTCPKCGNVWQCPRCAISLVYHKASDALKCHYCGYRHAWPGICPKCSNREMSVFGVGTQKVEQELQRLFTHARIFRLDKDTASHRGVYHKAYEEFKNENYDILLGTQMVAKGFDFPRVTLVGVIDADTALYLPDFRSQERTFQLITQVAGRSGRSSLGGEVIVQTRYPAHYALLSAKEHDYRGFYKKEADSRMQMNYPPFTRLANILVRASKQQRAIDNIDKINTDLKKFKETHGLKYDILGPTPAAHSKLRRLFRFQVMLKGPSDEVIDAARSIRNYYLPRGVLITIDVDPQSVL